MNPEMWLALFGAFFGGVAKGWLGESKKKSLDPIVPEDEEEERNRKARERLK